MYNPHYGYMFGGGFVMIVFWVFIIIFIVWLVRYAGMNEVGNKKALNILRERYARGEIDKKEFNEKKEDLNN